MGRYWISEINAPRAYYETRQVMKVLGVREESRNGPVVSIPAPFMLEIERPDQRVIFDAHRDANPFFHLFEAIWMFAGRDDIEWIGQFNSNFKNYAEVNGRLYGAYGYRWRKLFGIDQIKEVVHLLTMNPNTRRAVMTMWSAPHDLGINTKDHPCNTHIYFRVVRGKLDMTVCNRSNDLIWGMFGSNIVHMTMLQELVARAVGIPMGYYYVFTNNLHVYPNMPRFEEIYHSTNKDNAYLDEYINPYPLLQDGETLEMFSLDASDFCLDREGAYRTEWFNKVAVPAMTLWRDRSSVVEIAASDWHVAMKEWVQRRVAP